MSIRTPYYKSSEKNLMIITHGCALAYIIAWWLKFKPEMISDALCCASPASISVITSNRFNQRVLKILNDTSHLKFIN